MKKLLLIILPFYFLSSGARAEDDIPVIEKLVFKWNDIHNTGNASSLRDLYNYSVLFYGQYTSRELCLNKKRAFLQDHYSQEIISPIKIDHFTSGTIRCSFIKRVKYRENLKEYPAYLLLEKRGSKYIITGESDLITDQNLHFQLNLGQPINTAPANNILLIIAGAAVLVAVVVTGFFVFRRKKLWNKSWNKSWKKPRVKSFKFPEKIMPAAPIVELPRHTDEKKKDPFEKFVVERFDETDFEILEWSDKTTEERPGRSNRHPGLEIRFRHKDYNIVFDVACRWRKGFFDNKILWAKPHQWDIYNEFEHRTGKPVFVVIGVGDDPGNPENIFILPLKKICSTELSLFQLKQYQKVSNRNFFFDPENRILT